jgi:hypothetical protein
MKKITYEELQTLPKGSRIRFINHGKEYFATTGGRYFRNTGNVQGNVGVIFHGNSVNNQVEDGLAGSPWREWFLLTEKEWNLIIGGGSVKNETEMCPTCNVEMEWVNMALKCPVCWRTT